MQKVKFTVTVSDGGRNSYRSGGTFELEQAEADHWVGLGFAEPVDQPEPKSRTAKKAAASKSTSAPKAPAEPATEPAKRTAKKTAKKTAVKRAPSTAAKD